jgi:transposase
MSKSASRIFSREFKLSAVCRILAGENVSALSRELKVRRKDLYLWRSRVRSGGPEALRSRGRPRKEAVVLPAVAGSVAKAAPDAQLEAAGKRIAELERKVGQQQVDIDFFRQALRQVRGERRPSDELGVTASTKSSRR